MCGQVSDRKFSPGRFPETRLLFFDLTAKIQNKRIDENIVLLSPFTFNCFPLQNFNYVE